MSNLNTNKRKGKLYVKRFTALIFTHPLTGNAFEKSFILFSNVIAN